MKTIAPLVAALAAVISLTPSSSADDQMTHEEKVMFARRLLSPDRYVSEIGSLGFNPTLYEQWSDAQVQQELARLEPELEKLKIAYQRTSDAFHTYRASLITRGKVADQTELTGYNDPTGRLQNLEAKWNEAGQKWQEAFTARWQLLQEQELRRNPDHFIAVVADERAEAPDARAVHDEIKRVVEAYQRGEEWVRQKYKLPPPGTPGGPPEATKQKLFSVGKPGDKTVPSPPSPRDVVSRPAAGGGGFELTYESIFGPGVDSRLASAFEQEALLRLPEELKRGVPPEIQRLYVYGGWEQLTPEAKKITRRTIADLKASGQINDEQVKREYVRALTTAEADTPPTSLSNQTPAQAAEASAWLLVDVLQRFGDYTYDHIRRQKWQEACRKVAAEIPAGQQEPVVFMEEMERVVQDPFEFLICHGVTAYRGTVEMNPDNEGGFEKLADWLHASWTTSWSPAPPYWKWTQIRMYTIPGTGGKAEAPSVAEAERDGYKMGELARGGKLNQGLMRNTYSKYNKDPATREAFKRGWRRATGNEDFTP